MLKWESFEYKEGMMMHSKDEGNSYHIFRLRMENFNNMAHFWVCFNGIFVFQSLVIEDSDYENVMAQAKDICERIREKGWTAKTLSKAE